MVYTPCPKIPERKSVRVDVATGNIEKYVYPEIKSTSGLIDVATISLVKVTG